MKRFAISLMMVVLMICFVTSAYGQFAQPTEQHEILKKDVGTWDAEMKMWMPGVDEPQVASGTETNVMLGDFWLISKFEGELAPGMEFTGHGVFGYDEEKQKFVGTWCDNVNPYMSTMEGTYDEETETMTMTMRGRDADGSPIKGKNVSVMKDEDTRVFTMYMEVEGEMVKSMEITYTRKD